MARYTNERKSKGFTPLCAFASYDLNIYKNEGNTKLTEKQGKGKRGVVYRKLTLANIVKL